MAVPDSFSTARLRAERLTADHLAELCRMDSDPEFMGLLGGVRDAAQTAAYLARNLRHWAEYGFGLWILRDETGRVVGRAVLRHLLVERVDEVELGYAFFADCWGRGLASEIAAACLQLGLRALARESIVAITRPDNARSRRVMTKVGLVYERDFVHDGIPHVLYRSVRAVT